MPSLSRWLAVALCLSLLACKGKDKKAAAPVDTTAEEQLIARRDALMKSRASLAEEKARLAEERDKIAQAGGDTTEVDKKADGISLIHEPWIKPFFRCNIWHVRGRDRDIVEGTRRRGLVEGRLPAEGPRAEQRGERGEERRQHVSQHGAGC